MGLGRKIGGFREMPLFAIHDGVVSPFERVFGR